MTVDFEAQLKHVLAELNAETNDLSARIRAFAAIDRIAGPHSVYCEQLKERFAKFSLGESERISVCREAIKVLLSDVQAGYLHSVAELIHGELFGDFLEMADHLLSTGYKDAAAVIAGSTLEGHLKQLCKKAAPPVDTLTPDGKSKKADLINAELAKAGAYGKLDSKNVTAWLDLRNKAAHGDYGAYGKEQVGLLVTSIREFITRIPA